MKSKPPLRWYHLRWQVALVLIVGFCGTWYYFVGRFLHPIGTGPAGPPVATSAFQRPWAAGPYVLIGLGDSVTEGYGARPGHGYFDLLVANDDAADPDLAGCDLRHALPQLKVRNLSESYTVSEQHLQEELPLLNLYPADTHGLVVITTGGNDLIHDYGRSPPKDGAMFGCTYAQAQVWAENFRGRLTALLTRIAARFPGGCDIFLANIYDPTDGVGDIGRAHLLLPDWPDGLKVLALFNQVIADASRTVPQVHLVDLHALMLGHGIHCRDSGNTHYDASDPHYWYFTNLEDPNERGFDAIRREFLNAIGRQLAPPAVSAAAPIP